MIEYRVTWRREGSRKTQHKRYATKRAAERFMTLLGPEPWTAFGRGPDDYRCCPGASHECGCGGETMREESDARRKDIPPIEECYLESRTVPEWELTGYTLLSDGVTDGQ